MEVSREVLSTLVSLQNFVSVYHSFGAFNQELRDSIKILVCYSFRPFLPESYNGYVSSGSRQMFPILSLDCGSV